MNWLAAILPTLAVAIFMLYLERAQRKRDIKSDDLAQARKDESLLSLDMQFSTAKLSYATAIALKRGYANGEVEEGIIAYEDSKKKYVDFLNKQATERLAI